MCLSRPALSDNLAQVEDTKSYLHPAPLTDRDLSQMMRTGSYRVKRVIDDLTLVLDNDKIIRLVGLDIPDRHADKQPAHAIDAYNALKTAFAGKEVTLYQTRDKKKGRTNRMQHELAHIIRSRDKLWAQGLLLRNGFARLRTTPDNPELAAQMQEIEAQARDDDLGLWTLPKYSVLSPQEADTYINSFQIVEGRVRAVASVRNTIYLNFGQNWRQDFTIALPVSLRKDLLAQGLDPMTWQGKYVQARGWLEKYNGPYLDITHIEKIQLIDRKDASYRPKMDKNAADNTAGHARKTLPNGSEGNTLQILQSTPAKDEMN